MDKWERSIRREIAKHERTLAVAKVIVEAEHGTGHAHGSHSLCSHCAMPSHRCERCAALKQAGVEP